MSGVFSATGSGETKKTTFTELKRDFIMIPDYNPLFDYGKVGARQAELTMKVRVFALDFLLA